eukprot:Amastigsp_a2744_6.p6 type:complete len:132 gc:universal Amastigsp_a2744_6:858-463(-)
MDPRCNNAKGRQRPFVVCHHLLCRRASDHHRGGPRPRRHFPHGLLDVSFAQKPRENRRRRHLLHRLQVPRPSGKAPCRRRHDLFLKRRVRVAHRPAHLELYSSVPASHLRPVDGHHHQHRTVVHDARHHLG